MTDQQFFNHLTWAQRIGLISLVIIIIGILRSQYKSKKGK